jgi:hypothetical protein
VVSLVPAIPNRVNERDCRGLRKAGAGARCLGANGHRTIRWSRSSSTQHTPSETAGAPAWWHLPEPLYLQKKEGLARSSRPLPLLGTAVAVAPALIALLAGALILDALLCIAQAMPVRVNLMTAKALGLEDPPTLLAGLYASGARPSSSRDRGLVDPQSPPSCPGPSIARSLPHGLAAPGERHRVDHGTSCGRSRANSGHYKPLCVCVDCTFVNQDSSRRRPEKFGRPA